MLRKPSAILRAARLATDRRIHANGPVDAWAGVPPLSAPAAPARLPGEGTASTEGTSSWATSCPWLRKLATPTHSAAASRTPAAIMPATIKDLGVRLAAGMFQSLPKPGRAVLCTGD